MSTRPDASIVICAYTEDRWADLADAVDSVLHQSLPAREVLLVVDYNPRLLERARQSLAAVTVIPNTQPQGLSGARNSGVAAARGDIVAFLDDDATAASDWLEQLVNAYTSARVAGVGGAIEPVWLAGRPEWFPDEFAWVVGCTYRGLPTTTASVRNLIGANMSFRRGILESLGGFRHGLGRTRSRLLGCEETELCIRLNQRWPDSLLVFEPRARVCHRVPATRSRWSYFRARCYAEGLSKAALVDLVGAPHALRSERRYVLSTLTKGVWRELRGTILRRGRGGLPQAAAIAAGLSATAAGYVRGRLVAEGPA